MQSKEGQLGKSAKEILDAEFEERQFLLRPFLYRESLTLLYAPPGVGKSLFCLSLACSLASASPFLSYTSMGRFRVLYVDGEMTLLDHKERLQSIAGALDFPLDHDYLRLITTSDFPNCLMPPLTTATGKKWFVEQANKYDVIIIDNLGCVAARTDGQSDEQAWISIAPLLISARQAKKAVILIHHAGKSGEQLGTSLKEQAVDFKISLVRPLEAELGQSNSVSFELRFEKVRGKNKAELQNLSCRFVDGRWLFEPVAHKMKKDIIECSTYMKPHEIAQSLGVRLHYVKKILFDHNNSVESLEKEENMDFYNDFD